MSMKNSLSKLISLIFLYLFISNAYGAEQFNFDVTEVQILENGNKFIGTKRGLIRTNKGIEINADQFEYDKILNVLKASGNVKITDLINKYIIYTKNITYQKNDEIIFTTNGSKAISINDSIEISADDFNYNLILNTITAEKKVGVLDKANDYKISSDFLKYFKNEEKIITKGKTLADIKSKYNIESSNITFLRNKMEMNSNEKTIITDKLNLYSLSKFKYFINEEELRGEKILISSNYNLPKNDNFYFSSGIIDLKNLNFKARDTEITIHKDIFDNSENDPRIKGVSSSRNGEITIINKGVFTSCKKNENCPPWAIQANEIKHDKKKNEIYYKNAILRVYDIPILYLPKFFHPDPTVKRRSGILKPTLNNSNVTGSSITLPYYHVISEESDITLAPTIFDSGAKLLQNEYRKIGEKFNLLINFGHNRNYKSATQKKEKNTSYLFSKFELDLDFEEFNSSKMYVNLEKVTNDTFLKIFDSNLIETTSSLKPKDNNILNSELKLILNNENYNFTTGFQSYENLQLVNNDRYQYILPYYDFNTNLFSNFLDGYINFNSTGKNDLNNTNQLKSRIINNLSYSSLDFFSSSGFKNNYSLNIKNLNSLGKNISEYKSSPQVEFSTLAEFKSSIPLIKKSEKFVNLLTPKISFRVNPSDMKNYKTSERIINTDNIFSIDRLGLGDTFEAGRSITLGVDYKKQMLKDVNKYFEIKLASVLRDKEQNFIPEKTTINKKTSNIFGSLSTNFSENLNLNYRFAVDNNLDEIKYNDIGATFSLNNFVTTFNFIEEKDEMGDQNLIENNTIYKFDDQNQISFNTRRNRKINLTEFYDLVYEYKNDCLVAGIKYKKTYYEDRDLKPVEDLLFTVTLFPLTTFEQKIDD